MCVWKHTHTCLLGINTTFHMMNCQSWPEPVVRVQALAESGLTKIPARFIKPESQRPGPRSNNSDNNNSSGDNRNIKDDTWRNSEVNIPVVDMAAEEEEEGAVRRLIGEACREWGFFQVVNHGVRGELMRQAREMWREFFKQPLEVKEEYANSPITYEGYGSRLGVKKGAILDWSDYFFLHYTPQRLRDPSKWPSLPSSLREVIDEYGKEVVKLGGRILRMLSENLGLEEEFLMKEFGGEDEVGACLRVNFYPSCPQPDLTLGLSPHSDPGGMTILLPDDHVAGLQVRRQDQWITVKPLPDAFIINIGDQIQVLSNAIYKSIEHRVIVNSNKDRVSLAFFYNPRSDLLIQPAKELVSEERPSLYSPMTFDEYRLYIRTKGPCGKAQVDSLTSSSSSS